MKRIDLTQFDGHTEDWLSLDDARRNDNYCGYIYALGANPNYDHRPGSPERINIFSANFDGHQGVQRGMVTPEQQRANFELLLKAPILKTALAEAYAEIDRLTQALNDIGVLNP